MKTNKLLFLTIALATCARPAYGVNTASATLKTVGKVVDTAQHYWKPVTATVAVVALGYWLWSYCNQETKNPEIKKVQTKEEKIVEGFEKLKRMIQDENTSVEDFEKTVLELQQQDIFLDILKFNNNPTAHRVIDMETLFNLAEDYRTHMRQSTKRMYIQQQYYNNFKDYIEMHKAVLSQSKDNK